MQINVRVGKGLRSADIRQPQHAMCRAVHRCFFHIEMEVADSLVVADLRRLRTVENIERVARAVCRRTARDHARDLRIAQIDAVVVGHCAETARDGLDRSIGDIHGIARCLSRSLAADDVGVEGFLNGDGVARRLAARHVGIAAVNRAADRRRFFDDNGVIVAVPLVRRTRARAARPAAVYGRMAAAIDGDCVFARRVACLGDAAVEIAPIGRCRRYTLELVALIGDFGDLVRGIFDNVDVRFRRLRRLRLYRARVAREVNAVRILEERERFYGCARCAEGCPVDIRLRRARDFEHGIVLCKSRCVKVHLLDVCNRTRLVILALHVQRVARAVCRRAARDRACDFRAVEIDGVVIRRRACTACDIARNCDVSERHRVMRCRTRRPAAVHVRMRVLIQRERVVLNIVTRHRASAPCIRADGCRRGCILKGIAVADNLFLVRARLDVRFPRATRTQIRAEGLVVRERQRMVTLHKRRCHRCRCKICLDGSKIKRRICRCQLQFGILVLERNLREVPNRADGRRRVDVQRVARGGLVPAVDLCDRCPRRKRMRSVAEVDGVVVRRAI